MCRSSLRTAALLLLLTTPLAAFAQSQPDPVVSWLAEEAAGADGVVAPSPEPVSDEQNAEAALAPDGLASELAAAVIGVDRLPALGRVASPAIWAASSGDEIRTALAAARQAPFRSVNLLFRELLLTPVDAADTPFAAARAEALLRIGAVPEALTTAHAATAPNAAILDIITRAALLYGHGATPCRHARLAPDEVRVPGAAGIYCAARQDAPAAASVRLELALDLGEVSPAEAALLDAMIHPEMAAGGGGDSAGGSGDFAVGLAADLGRPRPEDFVRQAPPRHLWRLTEESNPSPGERLLAMARLEAAGLFDATTFRNALLRLEADPGDEMGVWTALLLQMAETRDPALFGQLVEASLKLGRLQGREATAARLMSLPVRSRGPGVADAGLTHVLRRLFLLADDAETGQRWLGPEPPLDMRMLFAIALPGFAADWPPAAEAEAVVQAAESGDPRAGRLLAALVAFGLSRTDAAPPPVPPAPGQPPPPGAGILAMHALARLTETPAPEGTELGRSLAELVAAGFGDRARQIAIEVILLAS